MTGTEVAYLPNPRREAEENELRVLNDQFLALGLPSTTLSEGLMEEITEVANRYRHRVDPSRSSPAARCGRPAWRPLPT